MAHETCHHGIELAANVSDLSLLITIFVTGFVASLTHCVMMCGPFAAAQMSMRLINLNGKLSELKKVKCAFLMPYYFGKATTYIMLAAAAYSLVLPIKQFMQYEVVRYTVFLVFMIVAYFFLASALSKAFSFTIPGGITKQFEKFISRRIGTLKLSSEGVQGYFLGMVLGLIPCGLVYSTIFNALSSSSNLLVALLAVFLFGMSTIPGLFLSAYFGAQFLSRFNKSFKLLYAVLMVINAAFIIRYGLKLL